jgi:hypothetical protein
MFMAVPNLFLLVYRKKTYGSGNTLVKSGNPTVRPPGLRLISFFPFTRFLKPK